MSTDIDPAFAARCEAAAINLRTLADLEESPDADPDPIARASWLTGQLLADPEALLAVALVIEQQRAAQPVLRRFSQVNDLDTSTRTCPCGASITWSGGDPALSVWSAKHRAHVDTDAVEGTVSADGARAYAAPPRADDLSTLRPGETRLVGGRMWARCKSCGAIGPLDGPGSWHVCDPVRSPSLGDRTP